MTVEMKITQGRTVFLDLLVQQGKLDQDVRAAVRALANEMRARIIADLRAPKGGRQYGARKSRAIYRRVRRQVTLFGGAQGSYRATQRVKSRTRAYTASRPGEAPAVFSGTLARAVRAKVPQRGKGWSAYIFADRGTAFYRHFLEFGTDQRQTKRPRRNVGRVAPRPVWSKRQAQIERVLPRVIGLALDRFQRGG